jgi:predicted  nucleic acid-binding Zn-ribbon protein
LQSKEYELRHIVEERAKYEANMDLLKDQANRAQRGLEFEKKCREEDIEGFQAEIKDLQDQIAEYEEETMTL